MTARERLLAALEGSPEVRPGEGPKLVADLLAEETGTRNRTGERYCLRGAVHPAHKWMLARRVYQCPGAADMAEAEGYRQRANQLRRFFEGRSTTETAGAES